MLEIVHSMFSNCHPGGTTMEDVSTKHLSWFSDPLRQQKKKNDNLKAPRDFFQQMNEFNET